MQIERRTDPSTMYVNQTSLPIGLHGCLYCRSCLIIVPFGLVSAVHVWHRAGPFAHRITLGDNIMNDCHIWRYSAMHSVHRLADCSHQRSMLMLTYAIQHLAKACLS